MNSDVKLTGAEKLLALTLVKPDDAQEILREMSESEKENARLKFPNQWVQVLEHIIFKPKKLRRGTKAIDETQQYRAIICMYRAMLEGVSFNKAWGQFYGKGKGKKPRRILLNSIDQWDLVERAFYLKRWKERAGFLARFEFFEPYPTKKDFEVLLASKGDRIKK